MGRGFKSFCPCQKIDKFRLVDFFIQAAGLVCNLTAGENGIAVGAWNHRRCIFCGLIPYRLATDSIQCFALIPYTASAVIWYTRVQPYSETHENIFFVRFFIQAAGLAYHRRTNCDVYHQGRVAPLYLITRQRVNADSSAMDMNSILEGELRRYFIMNTMIKTERLTLAPLCENDRDALVAIFRDDIVKATYMLPDLDDDGEADKMFSRLLSISRANEHFLLGIYCNHTLIGIINDVGTEDKTIELGYAIAPEYHNRGFMTEALRACISHLKALGFSTIRCGAFDGNLASFRVMEKCGMQKIDYTETIEYREKTHICTFYEI